MIPGKIFFISANDQHRRNVTFATKNKLPQISIIFKRSESFPKNTKKIFLVKPFQYKIATLNSHSVIRLKEGLYHRYFSGEVFENGWL